MAGWPAPGGDITPQQARQDTERRVDEVARSLNRMTLVRADEFVYEANRAVACRCSQSTVSKRYQPPGVRLVLQTTASGRDRDGSFEQQLCYEVR